MEKNIYYEREIFEIKDTKYFQIDEAKSINILLNNLILEGIKKRASDIHIETLEILVKIRIRIDGKLVKIKELEKNTGLKLLNRIKILCELNIGEKRLPQDGRFKGEFNKEKIDFRVSTIPTIFGEKCVIRILKNRLEELNIEKLGFSEKNLKVLKEKIKRKNGLLLFCGPTGSGKTTTLYSIINFLNNENVNIITIEDPVEYQLTGINQIQCKNDIGLDFAKILRSVLRQDPDIILVGEIRDKETAEIALMASLTGHLVLSTLHTRNSYSAIERLLGFGIEPYIISAGLTLIESQRLVRRICKRCSGKGCEECNDGYFGREAVEEIIEIDDEIRKFINKNERVELIEEYLKRKEFVDIFSYGKEKIERGITTIEEVIRECKI